MPIPIGEADISCLILKLDCKTALGGGGGGAGSSTEMTVESVLKEKEATVKPNVVEDILSLLRNGSFSV